MELHVFEDKELMQLPSSDSKIDEQEQLTKKPRLTMKFLNELIRGLQHENFVLVQRVEELEQQFAVFCQSHQEAGAAVEEQAQREAGDLQDAEGCQEDVQQRQEVQGINEFTVQREPHASEPAEKPELQVEPDIWQTVRIPRSERHPAQKRNSFWPFRFHHRSVLR